MRRIMYEDCNNNAAFLKELFWKEIKRIQDFVVNISLPKSSKYDDIEKLLNDVTYETIYSLMELIDGLANSNIKGEIISMPSGRIINANENLHDYCEAYLNCSEI